MQIYFLIYLRRLRGSLKPDDDGWDVPWIAMDSGILAQATVFATIAFLPFASLLTVDVATTRQMMSRHWSVWNGKGHLAWFTGWHWIVDVRLALMLLCLSISTHLAVLC